MDNWAGQCFLVEENFSRGYICFEHAVDPIRLLLVQFILHPVVEAPTNMAVEAPTAAILAAVINWLSS